jgi:hypothetical protein
MFRKLALAAAALAWPLTGLATEDLRGAKIVAADGQALGVIGDRFSEDSISNPYGAYGNRFSSKSIWNSFGEYGGRFSERSPFNPRASAPPKVMLLRGGWRWLTVNPYLTPRIDPNTLARPLQ